MKILSKKEVGEISKIISENYGAEEILKNYIVIVSGKKNKIWITNRTAAEIELKNVKVNSIGLYFGRIDKGKLRLSIEGAQMVAKSAKKNIAEIQKDAVWDFIRGFDVETETENLENTYVIVKCGEDILGIAKHENGKLFNVLPKARKLISLTKPM